MAIGDSKALAFKADVDAETQRMAPIELSNKASQAYAGGAFFVMDGVLYKATAAIKAEATITPGTNCTATTAGSEISKTNQTVDALNADLNEILTWSGSNANGFYFNEANFANQASEIKCCNGMKMLKLQGVVNALGNIMTINTPSFQPYTRITGVISSNGWIYEVTIEKDGAVGLFDPIGGQTHNPGWIQSEILYY